MNCPHCKKPIEDAMILSESGRIIRSKATKDSNVRTKEHYQEMARKSSEVRKVKKENE